MATPSENDDLTQSVGALDGSGASVSPSAGISINAGTESGSAAQMLAALQAANRYEVGTVIARGGMGAILNAREATIERVVAMKVVLDTNNPTALSRFVTEAKVTGQLEHPNIVPVHELGVDEKQQVFYTMKFVKGVTLRQILEQLAKGDAATIKEHSLAALLTILQKVCDAMAFAHSKGVIHRDLKPENIMIGKFGEVLVMDWGLAKILGQAESASKNDSDVISASETATATKTMAGAVLGTLAYMAPEQAMGQIQKMDARSDIYALGGILYHILALRSAVDVKMARTAMLQISSGAIVPPEKTVGQTRKLPHLPGGRIPESLSAVAMKALALDQKDRYQTVPELQRDIEAYQNGFATSAEHAGLVKQVTLLVKRNKGIFATAFAAWFIITALLGWFVINLRDKESRAVAGEQKAKAEAERASKAELSAKTAEAIAVQEKETARKALAKSQLDLAEKEFERGKFVEAEKILEETPESFRDANWRFLRAHSRDFTAQFSMTNRGSVYWLQFLPQGDRFVAKCFGGAIGIFMLTNRQIGDWVWASKQDRFGAARIDSAGSRMAFAASANEVAVQEVATGKLVHRWTCEIREIRHVLLSPDGGTVLVAGGNQLFAYLAQTGVPLWTKPFDSVIPAFSPDSRAVAILAARTGVELKIQLLDTTTGEVRSTLEATADNPTKTTLQFNQAGDRLACLGGDEVILWNSQTAAKIRALHFPGESVKMLNPIGDTVASTSGGRIRLWDTTTGGLLRSLNGARNEVLDLAFSPDGKMLLSAHLSGADGFVNVWPTRLGEELAASRPGTSGGCRVLFDRDASGFYACAKWGAAAWDIRSGIQRWKFSAETINLFDLAIHPADGSIILSEYGKGFTRVPPVGETLEAFGTSLNSSVKFNRDGQILLAVDRAFNQSDPGSAFRVMEYPSGKVLRITKLENPRQPFAAFCLDDTAVATAALAGGITVWDWKAGTPLRQIAAAQTGSISCLAASPDGLHLATAGPDRWIRVWDAATGQLEGAFRAHWEGVRCVKFSPDGREILSGSEDGAVRLHDAVTGEERLAFYGSNTPMVDVDFSLDGTLIAAITTDGFTKVWDRKLSSEAALLPPKETANGAPLITEKEDRGRKFDILDKEKVGKITREYYVTHQSDAKAAVERFDKWDTNHDDFLSRDEFVTRGRPNADGWEDLLAQLTPDEVEKTGHGWSLKDGELFSPAKQYATLPLPGALSGTSYRVRLKLRQTSPRNLGRIMLPVGDRMTGFEMDWTTKNGIYTGLSKVNGKSGKDLPGVVEGKQLKDSEPHDLEVTVRLEGDNATITTTLDAKPLYEWTGLIAALSLDSGWATTVPGTLALGTTAANWVVSEVKVKRLEKKP